MIEATLTSKGQITIPQKVRNALKLKAGGKVVFFLEEGEAIMIPKTKDPMKELLRLRDTLPRFSREDIRAIMKESKKQWSTYG